MAPRKRPPDDDPQALLLAALAADPECAPLLEQMQREEAARLATLTPAKRRADRARQQAEAAGLARMTRDLIEASVIDHEALEVRSRELEEERRAGRLGTLGEVGRKLGLSAAALGRALDGHGLRALVEVPAPRPALHRVEAELELDPADVGDTIRVMVAVSRGVAVHDALLGKTYWVVEAVRALLRPAGPR